jgi:UDP-2,3-diacylglucosamine hydrolase
LKYVFFSDTHLQRNDPEKTDRVAGFLRSVCGDADGIVVLGDLFEFFYGYNDYVYAWYKPVIDALKGFASQGKAVYFIEGNHEYNLQGMTASTGIVCAREMTLAIEGRKVYLCHGDMLVSPLLPAVLKSRPVLSVMSGLGPMLTWHIAMASRIVLSRKEKPYNTRAKRALRERAKEKFGQGFDVVIFGHSHVADRVEYGVGKNKRLYLNTGDLSQYGTYVEYTSSGGFRIGTFPPAAPSP